MGVLILTEKEVKKCLSSMREVIELVEAGIKALGEGKAIQPGKIYMDIPKYKGFIKPMTAYVETMEAAATKIFSLYKENVKYNLPSVLAVIELHDPKTGAPVSIMAGGYITMMRTAAATAIAAKHLANPDSKRVGIVGAGVQGRSHLQAINELFDIEDVKIFDISEKRIETYIAEMSKLGGIDMSPAKSLKDVSSGVDILVVATTANKPLIHKGWIEPGCFAAKIGSFQELDPELLFSVDKLVVDAWEYIAMRVPEAKILINEGKLSKRNVYGELAEIVAGEIPGRESKDESILFVALGMGVEDTPVAARAYARARDEGLGREIEFW